MQQDFVIAGDGEEGAVGRVVDALMTGGST